jgi:hypothetical protein
MNGILAASALFVAGGLSSVAMGLAPLPGVLSEALWAGMALASFLAIVGLEAAN